MRVCVCAGASPWRSVIGVALALSALAATDACVSQSFPDGYYACRVADPACPPGQTCHPDGLCRSSAQAVGASDAGENDGGLADATPDGATPVITSGPIPKGTEAGLPAVDYFVFVGDWNGDGTKTPGTYYVQSSYWQLTNQNADSAVDVAFQWKEVGSYPVVGDWDGDGTSTPGFYNPLTGIWKLSNTLSAPLPDAGVGAAGIRFGQVGYVPVVGDWDGDGRDTPGLYNPETGLWALTNRLPSKGPEEADIIFTLPVRGVPLSGDWSRSGRDTPALFDAKTHRFSFTTKLGSAPSVDVVFSTSGDLPLAGRWSDVKSDGIGLFTATKKSFLLAVGTDAASPTITFAWGPPGSYTVPGANVYP